MKKIKHTTISMVMIFAALLTFSNAGAQDSNKNSNWKLIKENTKGQGWSLYKKDATDSKLQQFKIVGIVSSSTRLAQKAAVDLAINPEHYTTKKGKVLGTFKILEQTEKEFTLYSLMYGPGFMKDRDVVIRYNLYEDSINNIMGLKWHHIDKKEYPPTKKIIRMPVDIGDWRFEEVDKNSCIATNILQFNPGGSIPSWMLNMMVKSMLPVEIENMREIVKTIETTTSVNNMQNWVLVKENKLGCKLYSRTTSGTDIKEFKVVGKMKSTPDNCLYWAKDKIINNAKYEKGAPAIEILENIPTGLLTYSVSKMPWPIKDRAMCERYTYYEDENKGMVGMYWKEAWEECLKPLRKKLVRMPIIRGKWEFASQDNQSTEAIYVAKFDPGKGMPSGMVNRMAGKFLLEEFISIKHLSEKNEKN